MNILEELRKRSSDCNNTASGDVIIGSSTKKANNHGAIINGASNGCSGGNYTNTATSRTGTKSGSFKWGERRQELQNLVVFTGKLTNVPSTSMVITDREPLYIMI